MEPVPSVDIEKLQQEASDLRRMAPGVWGILHMSALAADEEDNDETFDGHIYLIKLITKRFKAEECRQHFSNFVRSNPIHPGRAFEWTVRAHNEVNKRTGKAILSNDEARQIWGMDNVRITPCSGGSGVSATSQVAKPQHTQVAKTLHYGPTPATIMGPVATMNALYRAGNWNPYQ
jgi:hypothetical protein